MSTDGNDIVTDGLDSDITPAPVEQSPVVVSTPKPVPLVEELETELKTIVILKCPSDKLGAAQAAIAEASKSGTLVLPEGVDYTVESVPAFSSFVVQDVAKVFKFKEKSV